MSETTVTTDGRYVPATPYNWLHEGDVVCEAIGSHCRATVRSALYEAYQAGAQMERERAGLLARTAVGDGCTEAERNVAMLISAAILENDDEAQDAEASTD
jgi:hypothetical protein